MTRLRKDDVQLIDIVPDRIYRTTMSEELFGLGPQATADKIKNGELPMAFPLSESSRARAWTGQQILEHRARMRELAAKKLEVERARPKQEQPRELIGKTKVRKAKLRPPGAAPKTKRVTGHGRAF